MPVMNILFNFSYITNTELKTCVRKMWKVECLHDTILLCCLIYFTAIFKTRTNVVLCNSKHR